MSAASSFFTFCSTRRFLISHDRKTTDARSIITAITNSTQQDHGDAQRLDPFAPELKYVLRIIPLNAFENFRGSLICHLSPPEALRRPYKSCLHWRP